MNLEKFQNPENQYRPAPFWSVNDQLEPAELRRQVREFAAAGYGGWFFHPRVGIATKYLSDEWMDAFGAALDEGKKYDQLCWIYDEDSYPSGFAGGQLLRQFPEYGVQFLKLHSGPLPEQGNVIRRFAVKRDNHNLLQYRLLQDLMDLEESEQVISFTLETDFPSGWLNGGGYVDLLNPEAVRKFLDITHERYAAQFAEDFGKNIPGVFTDEPHIMPQAPNSFTWTNGLPELFEEKFGYSILERLPELFFNNQQSGKLRSDYWGLVAERFQESCIEQMANWCEKHNLVLTGHCWEHCYPWSQHNGSMGFAEIPMQWPGIDVLCANNTKEKLQGAVQRQVGRITVVKTISSLKNQFERERIMSETYGGAGWDVTFRDLKEILDWQCVLGVDYIVPHLSHYSLRGCRKRDYPAAFGEYAPWWPELRMINDYSGRLCYALSQGTAKTDVVVLQPLSPSWTHSESNPEEKMEMESFGLHFEDLLKTLSEQQWEYDLVDEMTLQKFGKPQDAKLQIGKAFYSVLIVPNAITLTADTATGIRDLLENGVRVLWQLPAPQALDKKQTEVLAELQQHTNSDLLLLTPESLDQALSEFVTRTITVRPADRSLTLPVYVQTRELDDGTKAVFWVNVADRATNVEFECPEPVNVEHWDLLSGTVSTIPACVNSGRTTWSASIAPGQSQLLKLSKAADSTTNTEVSPYSKKLGTVQLKPSWKIEKTDPNILVLDKAAVKIADSSWSAVKEVWQVLKELRQHFGIEYENDLRFNRARRFYDIWENPKVYDEIQLRCNFFCAEIPEIFGAVNLVVESGEKFALTVNGHSVTGPTGSWVAPYFTTFDVGKFLEKGRNEIILKTVFAENTELETMYLLGNFGVKLADSAKFELVAPVEELHDGAWNLQGLPFFGGRVKIAQDVKITEQTDDNWQLVADKLPLPVAKVFLDGEEVDTLLWPPLRIDLGVLNAGKHRIELECISGFRNTFGPWHTAPEDGPNPITGPGTWFTHHELNSNRYFFTPEGIPQGLRLERGAVRG